MTIRERYLFEVSWEVCNKVGGINTVIKSKIEDMQNNIGDNYCLIGPLFDDNSEFYEDYHTEFKDLRDILAQAGIIAKVGRWKVYGNPKVILVNYNHNIDQNKVLYELWEYYGVDSMTGQWDYIEPVIFSTMAGKVIEEASHLYKNYNIIAHFHEWMTGAGLLYIKRKAPHIASVLTSHSTVLGRCMASHGIDIYNTLQNIDPEIEAAKLNVLAKHSLETASAREADCFTTVSEITAREAKHILGYKPAITIPNGFNVNKIPDFDLNREYYRKNRERLLKFASQFLLKDIDKNTIIISTSGRYEYHNKGIDLIIETLGELYKIQDELDKEIIMFFFIIGGFVDMSKERSAEKELKDKFPKYSMISTHPLSNPYHDPIVNECHKKNLQNSIGDRINIIYVPAFLNGRDGILNMQYYDALSGCDLTIYPSFYEPWGYTPLESIAHSIPTISSDVSGFGKWILSNKLNGETAAIIRRSGINFNDSVKELKNNILSFAKKDIDQIDDMRRTAKGIALNAEWGNFIKNYFEAYNLALKVRDDRILGKNKIEDHKFRHIVFEGTALTRPRMRQFHIRPAFPKKIEKLKELASNICWSWDSEATQLFEAIDPVLFASLRYNPIALLDSLDNDILNKIIDDEDYMRNYEKVMVKFDKYLSYKKPLLKNIGNISPERPVAYFSMEYGFHESMPLYSGGLGILSGDHIKTSSDLNLPLIGIGLLYKNAYFRQHISQNGDQIAEYFTNNFIHMPLMELVDQNGDELIITVDFPGRILYAKVWEGKIGRTSVYFLDTDLKKNSLTDREITGRLYGGGKKTRIEQEVLLGIGGVKLLENELNIYPSVYHINEGHSAFLIVERLINIMEKHNIDIDTAKEVVRSSTVFTTHTPVPAGNETFDISLVENYFNNYIQKSKLNLNEFYEMGHIQGSDSEPYEMTVLALNNSYRKNGVSRLHSAVSRDMWADLWKGFLVEELPIFHITNGVHIATWLSNEMKELIIKYTSLNIDEDLLKKEEWDKISLIPDKALWQTHLILKDKLFHTIETNISESWKREGEPHKLLHKFSENLNPAILTIGFGRRFATYKRATLFMKNFDRIKRIIQDEKYPVQFIFAGKAHPEDKEGQKLIKEIVSISKEDGFLGKIIFLENYDMSLAKKMVSGVDVWLNNPRRPYEASGTSGQKAGINGVLNASILDGWWDEGYDGTNGWVIGSRNEFENIDKQDIADSESLYNILEKDIIQLYYSYNSEDIPDKWITMMKNSIKTIISEFNTHRMLRDYMGKMYEPAAKLYYNICSNNFSKAKEIAEWKKSIKSRFSTINILNVEIAGVNGNNLDIDDEISIILEIQKGNVLKEELTAEMLIVQENQPQQVNNIEYLKMDVIEENGSAIKYRCKYKADSSGKYSYGVRVLPSYKEIDDILDLNLVYWG
ncbi:MAG: alpha-glucan family phosphorylase [Spirochaetota bacterium]|nr:alpha-glucan family phosphorylase [Spirochaetota bacterium]